MTQQLYYIAHSSLISSTVYWWRRGGNGLTTDLNDAWQLPENEAIAAILKNDLDCAYPVEQVDAIARLRVDTQQIWELKSLKRPDVLMSGSGLGGRPPW